MAADGTVTTSSVQRNLDGIDVWPILTQRVAGQSAGDQASWEDGLDHPLGAAAPRLRQLVLNMDPYMEGQALLHGARLRIHLRDDDYNLQYLFINPAHDIYTNLTRQKKNSNKKL